MTQYMTVEKLRNYIGTDTFRLLFSENADAVAENIIIRTESLMESYFAKRYAVPVIPSPFTESTALSIAAYLLYVQAERVTVPEKTKQVYEESLQFLNRIVAGEMVLPENIPLETDSSLGVIVLSSEQSELKGF